MMTNALERARLLALLCAAIASPAVACGGKPDAKSASVTEAGVDLDGDALVLLPSNPVALARVDAKAFYASDGAGSKIARLAEKYLPLGDESGFVASRDLETLTVGAYSTSGADVAAVVRGKFDEAKIAAAAKTKSVTKTGAPLVESTYAGRTLYTVSNIGFTVLTPKTVLAGTESGIRRALERIQDKRMKRDIPPWMAETLGTDGAALAISVDLATQPVANAAIGSLPVRFLKGMTTGRFVASFKSPGLQFASTLSFGDADQASASADEIRSVDRWSRTLGTFLSFVPQIQGLDVNATEKDVKCKGAIDDGALGKLVDMAPGFLASRGGG